MCTLNRSVTLGATAIFDCNPHLLTAQELLTMLPERFFTTLAHCSTACQRDGLLALAETSAVIHRVRFVMRSEQPDENYARALVLEETYHALSMAEIAVLVDKELRFYHQMA
jgi:hypothetical protein